MNLAKYNKFIVAIAGVVAVVAVSLSDGKLSKDEDLAIASAAVAALGVFQIKNKYVTEAEKLAQDAIDAAATKPAPPTPPTV
jgi:hypothetical protein